MHATYRFGIEEEYFLADAKTRGTPRRAVKAFHAAARARLPAAEPELLRSQIEVASPPSVDFAEARGVLAELRAGLTEVGQAHGVLVFAAGTHPVARWSRQTRTEAERYARIMSELQMDAEPPH